MKKLLQRWLGITPITQEDLEAIRVFTDETVGAFRTMRDYRGEITITPTDSKVVDTIIRHIYRYVKDTHYANISEIRKETTNYVNSEQFLDDIVHRLKSKQLP